MKYLLLFLSLAFSQAVLPAVSEYEMKSTYLYNFLALTTFPNQEGTESINVCLYGRDNFGQSIKSIEGKKINNIPVAIARISSLSSAKKCHLLYVAEREAMNLKVVYNELGAAPVLVVTDTSVPSGAMINLYLESQKVMFEVNQSRAKSSGLQMSSKLLQYARPMLVQE